MKKILFYIILTIFSFVPILKVNALINNTSTTNILYAQYDSSYQDLFNWVYNTSDDYLFLKLEDYDYKDIIIAPYNYLSNGYNGISLTINLYGSLTDTGVFNYTINNSDAMIKTGYIDKFIQYHIYYNPQNNKFYSEYNFLNEITAISDLYINTEATGYSERYYWNLYGYAIPVSSNFIPYQVYFSNKTFKSINRSRKMMLYNEKDELIGEYKVGDDVPSWREYYHSLPSYLTGYEKVGLTPSDDTIIISNISKGSIYISVEDFNKCSGLFGYFDKELTSQPYSSVITDYTKTFDGLYIRQDFDLSSYPGADYVYYQKCQYIEGNDDIYKYLWLPDENYTSPITSTENNTGGLDYTYRVEENGEIVENTFSSLDNILDSNNPLLGNIFQDFSSNTFGLTSIITVPLSLITSISSSTCTDLSIPLPYINSNLTLPCMFNIYQDTFGSFFTLYQIITFGIVSYWVIVRIWNLVKDFKNPDHDEIEVLDL